MAHVIEPAASGRAKCRGCGQAIAKGELRFGERLPNPYGEGEMTLWFHLPCGAFKRPEPLLEALEGEANKEAREGEANEEALEGEKNEEALTGAAGAPSAAPPPPEQLRARAHAAASQRRLSRIDAAGRSPTGRARCRACREPIAKDAWRIGLVFYEEGFFNPAGFIHAGCARDYFETDDIEAILAPARHFAADLDDADVAALRREIEEGGGAAQGAG